MGLSVARFEMREALEIFGGFVSGSLLVYSEALMGEFLSLNADFEVRPLGHLRSDTSYFQDHNTADHRLLFC